MILKRAVHCTFMTVTTFNTTLHTRKPTFLRHTCEWINLPTYFFSNSPVICRFTKVVFPVPPSPTRTNYSSGKKAFKLTRILIMKYIATRNFESSSQNVNLEFKSKYKKIREKRRVFARNVGSRIPVYRHYTKLSLFRFSISYFHHCLHRTQRLLHLKLDVWFSFSRLRHSR